MTRLLYRLAADVAVYRLLRRRVVVDGVEQGRPTIPNHPLLPSEINKGGGEHGRDHRAAEKALQRAKHDHALDVPRPAAQQAGGGEAGGRGAEQPARRHHAR